MAQNDDLSLFDFQEGRRGRGSVRPISHLDGGPGYDVAIQKAITIPVGDGDGRVYESEDPRA